MVRSGLILVPLAGCWSGWDDARTQRSSPYVLSDDAREVDASFHVGVGLVTQSLEDTDASDGVDTAIPEDIAIDVAVEVYVDEASGDGQARFLTWGGTSTEVVPPPVEFGAGDTTRLYARTLTCPAWQGWCALDQHATLDLRDGSSMQVTLRLETRATADDEAAPYVSDSTTYELTFE